MTNSEYLRRWRARNPEKVAAYNAARRIPPTELTCAECGGEFEGRKDRLTCSRRCRDKRYQRLHPEEYKAKRRRKDARRRAQARMHRAERAREPRSARSRTARCSFTRRPGEPKTHVRFAR